MELTILVLTVISTICSVLSTMFGSASFVFAIIKFVDYSM